MTNRLTPALRLAIPAGGIARLAACPIGPRIVFDRPREGGASEADFPQLVHDFKAATDEVKTFAESAQNEIKGHGARLTELEQKMARRGGGSGGGSASDSPGHRLVESEEFKALAASSTQRGRARVTIEVKTLTSAAASGASLVAPDWRVDPLLLPRKRLVLRDLVAPGQTASNMIYYPRQTVRTMAAASVAENPSAQKPRSEIGFEQVQAPVRTIAHFTKASRQVLDDAPALRSIIDSEMRYGLSDVEDQQMLLGDGTGINLLGLMPQASPFVAPFSAAGDTPIDRLLQAIAQSEAALLPATGIVLNIVDWLQLIGQKDTQGRYLSAGPFGPGNQRLLWDLPVAASTQMPANNFLVGAFRDGAQIFDRMQADVMISTENEDDFVRNLVTVLCEERLAFAVKRPQAFVKGLLKPA